METLRIAKNGYEVQCDPVTGVCTAKLRVSRRAAYEIPEARQAAWVRSAVKNSSGREYLGYGFNVVSRGIDLAARTVTFIASTPQIDRYGDIIIQNGWDTKNYNANPVILFAHDSRALPIGRARKVAINEDGNLVVVAEFAKPVASYDLPEAVFQLVVQGMLNCVSVGFIPLEFEWRFEKDNEGNTLPYPSGRIYKKQELLEISVVPVPANPGAVAVTNSFSGYQKAFRAIEDSSNEEIAVESVERAYFSFCASSGMVEEHGSRNPADVKADVGGEAFPALLVKMYRDGQSRPFVLKDEKTALAVAMRAMCNDSAAEEGFFGEFAGTDVSGLPVYRAEKILTRRRAEEEQTNNNMKENCGCVHEEQKAVVPFKHYKLAPANAPWDAAKEMGSTDKPEDWRKMSTIVLNDGKNKGDYKLPHHKGPGADFATVRRGVAAALGRLNQVKSASAADKKGARTHLVKHMAEFQKAAGKEMDEDSFLRELESLEAMRDACEDGSETQEAVIRAIVAWAEGNEKAADALALARSWAAIGSEGKGIMLQEMARLFPNQEEKKLSSAAAGKKMARVHKSMSAAKDEIHSAHEDAMEMLGQACSMVEDAKPDSEDQSAMAEKIGNAYELAYEAKQMVRRAANRYAEHMQDAVDALDTLKEHVGNDAGGSNESDGKPGAEDDDQDDDGDGDVKIFLEHLATKTDFFASKEVTGTEPAESALTTGTAEAALAAALLKATADDHAAH